jgi:hypothetical protein
LIWIVLGVASLATVGLACIGHAWLAIVSFVAALAALSAALIRRYGGGDSASWEGRHFGRGPYDAADGTANFDLLARLTSVAQQLRDASAAEKWTVDWSAFERRLAQSQAAVGAHDLTAAAAEQLRAISSIMTQLRRQPEPGSDSGVLRL